MTNEDFSIEPIPEGAVFRIERPAKLNAITRPVLLGLAACLDELEARGARLLVVTGAGERAFCAGTDLGELKGLDAETRLTKTAMARDLLVRLSRSPLVSVAAINGLAFGGGLELAMACTLRIAAPHATMSLPEVKLGLLPAYAGTQFLPAIVGKARALEIMMTGRVLSSDEALAIGLVHRLAEHGAPVLDQALAFGREVVRWSPGALAWIRRCVDAAGPEVTDAGLAVEDAAVRANFNSADAREGIAAFLEKREPRFGKG
ncbi:enoyl-CoA hydratase/isomerase family protein [Burkholderiaceae bacterium FT117]|uniref:enoyl-CoA hydratase/isomerase family protein n=1 Tax=Zeimonas sediminis TaxID=2944268 RepID=UPI002342F7D8|nr:enoyl-CoA hydratase/isomerase family protein [Zeimonas sediminis]MCM5570094.1 enoyl-CoA hydratase/isomerase family protein [Zeimonas sediminis]